MPAEPTARDQILRSVRKALDRNAGDPIPAPPDLTLAIPGQPVADRLAAFRAALEKLGGKVYEAADPRAASRQVNEILAGRSTVCSASPVLQQCGFPPTTGDLREACATANVGITSAEFALGDTGSLVLFASEIEPRLVSLLPPCHIAIVPISRLLTGLNELFTRIPDPAQLTSAMVIITGPSRSADIEMILVRGVHGPGETHVIFLHSA